MANAASGYVVPAGRYLFAGLTGEDPSGNNEWRGASNIFDIGDPRGMFGSVTDAWNAQRLGYGTVAAPSGLGMGADEAMRRYAGDPNNGGAGGWDARWKQWNATDTYNPDGTIDLLSPVHATGLRIGQNYGARDYDGNPIEAGSSDMWNTAKGVRNNLNSDPYLDPGMQIAGLRAMAGSSQYGMPNVSDYTSAMRNSAGYGGGDPYLQRGVERVRNLNERTDFDKYGSRGVDQTNALASANIDALNRNIDTESQRTLAFQLPEISQAMEAAGLGRSGAGQLQLQQAMSDVLGQANRDKQRTMADYGDREANRQAQAINLATQQGFAGQGQEYGQLAQMLRDQSQGGMQSYENYAGRQGQAALAGLGDQFSANQQGRQNEQALWSQGMQNRFAKNQGDQNALFGMLTNAGSQQNDRMRMEDQGRSMALADWLGLQGNRDQMQQNSLNQLLTLQNAQRQIQQDQLNQMLQAGMMPLDWMGRIATGTTAPSGPAPQNNSFWNSGLGGAIGNMGASAVGAWLNGGGQANSNSGMGYNPNEF